MIRPARNLLGVSLALVLVTLLFLLYQPTRPIGPNAQTATAISLPPIATPAPTGTATAEPTSVIAATEPIR